MDPVWIDLFEPAVVLGTLLGVTFGVKHLIWGKGPIKRRGDTTGALTQRIAQLEERHEQSVDLIADQAEHIQDLEERIDFAERMLTRIRGKTPPQLSQPKSPTPA